jgi:hypothetical protein
MALAAAVRFGLSTLTTTASSPDGLPRRRIAKKARRALRVERRCRQAVVAAAKPVEDRALLFPHDQNGRVPAALECRIDQRDARFGLSLAPTKAATHRSRSASTAVRGTTRLYAHPAPTVEGSYRRAIELDRGALRAVEGFECALISGRRCFRADTFDRNGMNVDGGDRSTR